MSNFQDLDVADAVGLSPDGPKSAWRRWDDDVSTRLLRAVSWAAIIACYCFRMCFKLMSDRDLSAVTVEGRGCAKF